jgi:arsenate reductase-like glutaredoxin family protein
VLQIIGTKKCTQTRKALRYCKERSIPYQFVNLEERPLSEGEWAKVFNSLEAESLIDEESKYYKKDGYSWREYDPEEELVLHSELLKTPLLKLGQRVVQGVDTDFLEASREHA